MWRFSPDLSSGVPKRHGTGLAWISDVPDLTEYPHASFSTADAQALTARSTKIFQLTAVVPCIQTGVLGIGGVPWFSLVNRQVIALGNPLC
jgi:hypothetical protein